MSRQTDNYINSVKRRFNSHEEFSNELDNVIKDLSEFPQENKHQIKFFKKIKAKIQADQD